jgi:hypothetical protein
MRAFLMALAAAAVFAVIGAVVLNSVQETSEVAFKTTSVRL